MTSQPRTDLRIIVADDERDMRQFLQEMLTHLGHQVVGVAENGRQLIDLCRTNSPDLIVTDIKMPDLDGLEAAAEANRVRPVPVVVISGHHEAALLERASVEYVMTYLVKPVKPTDLQAAVTLAASRFANLQQARGEAAELRQALEDRKVIERAKGAIGRRVGVPEDEAYRRMRKAASDHNKKMIDVAKQILAAEETFRALEEVPSR